MRIAPIIFLALFLMLCNVCDAHRMMIGYKVNELDVMTFYDDGTPAQGANIEVLSDGKPYTNGTTDEAGTYTFHPGKGVGDITFVGSQSGHRAELSLNLQQKENVGELSTPMRVAAGLGYLFGIAGLSMIYVSRKRKRAA